MAVATQGTASNYLQRAPSPSGLPEVIDLILDKGLVIDPYVRVGVIGIELVTGADIQQCERGADVSPRRAQRQEVVVLEQWFAREEPGLELRRGHA
jgi:hypothetical protein